MRKKHSQSTISEVPEDIQVMDETEADQVPIDDVEAINGVKFECPYCQDLVGDLAEHCLEKHGIEDETKGETSVQT